MTPQERQLVDDLFARLSKVEGAPRDPDATAAIAQGLRTAPNSVYALVQTVLVQDEALKQAHERIEQLEAASAPPEPQQSGSFLDSMRDAVFGSSGSHGSVPNVRAPEMNSRDSGRPVWNSGQVMQQPQGQGRYDQGQHDQGYGQQGYGQQGYGGGQSPMGGMFGGGMGGGGIGGGGGGSFLGTAAAAAAGMVGGSLLLNSFRGMMGGGSRQAFGDNAAAGGKSPWSDLSGSSLARDAGVNDIGSKNQDLAAQDRAQDDEQDREDDNNSRAGFFDQASNDDGDHDSDGFDGDGDSDYA